MTVICKSFFLEKWVTLSLFDMNVQYHTEYVRINWNQMRFKFYLLLQLLSFIQSTDTYIHNINGKNLT